MSSPLLFCVFLGSVLNPRGRLSEILNFEFTIESAAFSVFLGMSLHNVAVCFGTKIVFARPIWPPRIPERGGSYLSGVVRSCDFVLS